MRAVVQRVSAAAVAVGADTIAEIGNGLLVYLGVMNTDTIDDLRYLVRKVLHLRVFQDEHGKMNRSVLDTNYQILLVSQFTICGTVKKGHRPSFDAAAKPESAQKLYNLFADEIKKGGVAVALGQFQAHMKVDSVNDGPVTILLDSHKLF